MGWGRGHEGRGRESHPQPGKATQGVDTYLPPLGPTPLPGPPPTNSFSGLGSEEFPVPGERAPLPPCPSPQEVIWAHCGALNPRPPVLSLRLLRNTLIRYTQTLTEQEITRHPRLSRAPLISHIEAQIPDWSRDAT